MISMYILYYNTTGNLEAPYVERESAESPKDADFDHTDRPCSPP